LDVQVIVLANEQMMIYDFAQFFMVLGHAKKFFV